MNKQINYKIIIKIIAASIVVSLIYNYFSSNNLSLIRNKTKLIAASDSLISAQSLSPSDTGFVMITTTQAYKLFNIRKDIFIDARDQWDFADGHIPGAINIPEYDFEADNKTTASLDKQKRYIVYCHGIDCDVALRLAKELRKINFTNLLIFSGGWNSWIKAGHEIEKGQTK